MRKPHNLISTQQREMQEELQPFRKHYHDSDRRQLEHQLISLRLTLWPRITPSEPPATCLAIALLF